MASNSRTPSMMLTVQARACWAWYIARPAVPPVAAIRRPDQRSAISSAPLPAAMAGCDHLRIPPRALRLGDPRGCSRPWTRSRRSMATCRNPRSTWSWRNGTIASSSSRIRSSGDGCAIPIASRRAGAGRAGRPVPLAGLPEGLRRQAGEPLVGRASRKSRDKRTVPIAAATPSSGMPPSSRTLTIIARRTSPDEKRSSSPGRQDAERHQSRQVGRLQTRPFSGFHCGVRGHRHSLRGMAPPIGAGSPARR